LIKLTVERIESKQGMRAIVTGDYSPDRPPHVDRVDLESSRSRSRYAKALAVKSGASQAEIEEELLKIVEEQTQQSVVPPAESQEGSRALNEDQRKEAEEYLRSPQLFDNISADIDNIGVEGERELAATEYVVLTSRLLPTPLKAVVQGSSSSGKTFVVERVAELFPPEAIFKATSLSDQAWYYLGEDAVWHKVVILGEREQNRDPARVDARRAWRELVASDEASRVVTIVDPKTRVPMTVKKVVRGPCAFIETTTSESIMEEDASRMLALRPSESRPQTQSVIARTAREAAGQRISDERRAAIIARHFAVQRVLAEHTGRRIVVPYAELIRIPVDQVIARRVFSHVISVIQTVAFMRFLQKEPGATWTADFEDYEIAYPLLIPLVGRQLNRVTDLDVETLNRIEASCKAAFAVGDVAEALGIGERQTRRRLERLSGCGLIQETEESRSNRHEYKLTGRSPSFAGCGLTTPTELREAIEERAAIESEGNDRAESTSDETQSLLCKSVACALPPMSDGSALGTY
jgi:hypothetical protein